MLLFFGWLKVKKIILVKLETNASSLIIKAVYFLLVLRFVILHKGRSSQNILKLTHAVFLETRAYVKEGERSHVIVARKKTKT